MSHPSPSHRLASPTSSRYFSFLIIFLPHLHTTCSLHTSTSTSTFHGFHSSQLPRLPLLLVCPYSDSFIFSLPLTLPTPVTFANNVDFDKVHYTRTRPPTAAPSSPPSTVPSIVHSLLHSTIAHTPFPRTVPCTLSSQATSFLSTLYSVHIVRLSTDSGTCTPHPTIPHVSPEVVLSCSLCCRLVSLILSIPLLRAYSPAYSWLRPVSSLPLASCLSPLYRVLYLFYRLGYFDLVLCTLPSCLGLIILHVLPCNLISLFFILYFLFLYFPARLVCRCWSVSCLFLSLQVLTTVCYLTGLAVLTVLPVLSCLSVSSDCLIYTVSSHPSRCLYITVMTL